jgi:transcriptional regulator with XRE-family HTH domain
MSLYAKRASKNLRKMIVNSGLSVEKVAFGSGVSKATIHNYLLKKRRPNIAVLEKISDYLKKDFMDFFRA